MTLLQGYIRFLLRRLLVSVSFVVVAVVKRLRSQVVAPIVIAREGMAMTHAVFCSGLGIEVYFRAGRPVILAPNEI